MNAKAIPQIQVTHGQPSFQMLAGGRAKDFKINTTQGYSQLMTTLTAVATKLVDQRFYEIPFADYVPIVSGVGTFQSEILNWRSFLKDEGFETGFMNNASHNARLEDVDASYDAVHIPIINWAKSTTYNVFELEQAVRANTIFSLIEAREAARLKTWQLGVQEMCFLGKGGGYGILNSPDVNNDMVNLTDFVSFLSADDFNKFVAKVVGLYRKNCEYTAYPDLFVMPESDYNGMASFPSATYPLKSKLDLLTEAFKVVTKKPNFKILPVAYADKIHFGTNRYALYQYDPTSYVMNLPLDYTITQAGTYNNFNFATAGMGQVTNPYFLRPMTALYFSHNQDFSL